MFFGLWMFVIRRFGQGAGGLMAIGKSRAKIYVENDTKVTFADVAGVDEAKEELKEVVDFLKDPKGYGRLGARMPKGVLLIGPPGTGKTLLARAVAGEAGVPFFSITGSEFVEMFVGVGAARVRDLFEQARKEAPAIIFIDELDALGRARGACPYGGNDEKEQTLNQLLVEMDGFDPTSGVILLAATNRPEILDPALLRAGRFDRQVLVDRPDKNGPHRDPERPSEERRMLATDVDPEQIAALTPGFTGADLANLVNEAALLATRRGADSVYADRFHRRGRAHRRRPGEEEPAAQPAGARHRRLSRDGPRARGDGAARAGSRAQGLDHSARHRRARLHHPAADRRPLPDDAEELENRMAVLLGGRAAECILFNHLSTGAADDLVKATDIARSMVLRYGMDEKLGHVAMSASANPCSARRCRRAGMRVSSAMRRSGSWTMRSAIWLGMLSTERSKSSTCTARCTRRRLSCCYRRRRSRRRTLRRYVPR